ncbi:MAG TPA: hypothetical protein IAA27_04625 [Candidatus Enterococcus stercoravium]|nr:hypothetical protein [Candidatus Enterococcus stercoravium]
MILVGVYMQNNASLSQITLFLNEFKKCAEEDKIDNSEVKPKTTNFLRSIGWTLKAMNNYIVENIKPQHYFQGPTEHHWEDDRSVVEFGMRLEDVALYVKIELIIRNDEFISGFMSFHPREKAIDFFPLDDKGEVS